MFFQYSGQQVAPLVPIKYDIHISRVELCNETLLTSIYVALQATSLL